MDTNESRLAVENLVSTAADDLFARLDLLHKYGINDDDVTRILRDLGHNTLARDYIVWQNDGDEPTYDEDGPLELGEHLVTDPSDSETNRMIETAMKEAHVLDAITAQLQVEQQRELYFDQDYDGDDAMIDGPVNLKALAAAVVKALKA